LLQPSTPWAPRAPSLEALMALVTSDMNAVILERMQSKVTLIPELAGHLIAGGGNRMRPMLTLASGGLLAIPERATTSSPRRSSSSTPQPCSTTTLSMARACGAANAPPTSSGAIPAACWSAILFSRASDRSDR
jgi:geranylgeranyl pyrophosphate synthase